MEKLISRQKHGFIDYTFIPFTLAAPKMFGFEDEEKAVALTRVLAGTTAVSGLLTRAEWGVFKVMPFKYHLALDLATGGFALAAPWLFGFSKNKKALATFIGMGVLGLLAGSLTQQEEM